ncbi:MAG: 50S ribosomal protein L4 [Gemmatimonadaceae bacterium]
MAERESLRAATYTAGGTERDAVALPDDLFDGTVNIPVMHQAVKAFMANQRQGNAATKTRGLVVGGNQKPWRQKGTGRARQGSIRAPNWVGGGTVFGPRPRSYAQYVPRQVRALARKSALNARARENAIFVIDAFNYDAPRTSRLAALLARLDIADRKVLILTDGAKSAVHLSGRNIPGTRVLPYSDVSTYHVLWSDVVLIEASAIGHRLEPVEEKEAAESPARSRRRRKRVKSADDETGDDGKRESARKPAKKKRASAAKRGSSAPSRRGGTAKKKAATRKRAAKKKTSSKASTTRKAASKKSAAKRKRAPAKPRKKGGGK